MQIVGFEKPQKGNPHRLTVKQHVFPAASIRRFVDSQGLVQVFSQKIGKTLALTPGNDLFCAKRAWDQRAEVLIGKQIEDRFQELADGVLDGRLTSIGPLEKETVEEFFSLWRMRHSLRINKFPDLIMKSVIGTSLTQDEQEILEKNNYVFINAAGVMSGRLMAGIQIMRYGDQFVHSCRGLSWGIVRAARGEFIVPDSFVELMVIPLSPTIAIAADHINASIGRAEISKINREAISRSTDYYFARDLSKCPLI